MERQSGGVKGNTSAPSDFWLQFHVVVRNSGIPENQIQWHVGWAQQFACSLKGVPLRNRTAEQVKAFLSTLQSRPSLHPWQHQQASEALRLLYQSHLRAAWAGTGGEWPPPADGKTSAVPDREKFLDATVNTTDSPETEEVLARVRTEIRLRHLSIRTEQAYMGWIYRFAAFHRFAPLEGLGADGVKAYLEYLVEKRDVAANTQRQALNALVFLYGQVLQRPLGELGSPGRKNRSAFLLSSLSERSIPFSP